MSAQFGFWLLIGISGDMMLKKYGLIGSFKVVVVAVSVAVILGFGVVSPAAAYDERYAGDVRVLYGLSAPLEADIWLNDSFVERVPYPYTTDALLVPPGEVRLRAFEIGTQPDNAEPIFDKTFAAKPGQHLNVAVVGTVEDPRLIVHELLCDDVVFGQARVSFINAIFNGTANSVTLTEADGTIIPLTDTLPSGEAANLDLPAGRYILNVPDLLTDYPLSLSAGLTHTLYILENTDLHQIQVRHITGPTVLAETAGYLRFVNAVNDESALDLYVNNRLFGVGMGPSTAIPYFAVRPSNYEISVYEAASKPTDTQPLLTQTINVRPNISVGGVITGVSDRLNLSTYIDDRSNAADNSSGLAIYNATGEPVSLEFIEFIEIEDENLLDAIPPSTLSERLNLQDRFYTFDIFVGTAPLYSFDTFEVSPLAAADLRVLVVTETNVVVLAARSLPSNNP